MSTVGISEDEKMFQAAPLLIRDLVNTQGLSKSFGRMKQRIASTLHTVTNVETKVLDLRQQFNDQADEIQRIKDGEEVTKADEKRQAETKRAITEELNKFFQNIVEPRLELIHEELDSHSNKFSIMNETLGLLDSDDEDEKKEENERKVEELKKVMEDNVTSNLKEAEDAVVAAEQAKAEASADPSSPKGSAPESLLSPKSPKTELKKELKKEREKVKESQKTLSSDAVSITGTDAADAGVSENPKLGEKKSH